MINEAIRAIIDLLKLKKDSKKVDLEIEKLEREKAQSKSLIEIASLDDVKKYDPRVRELERFVRSLPIQSAYRPGGLLYVLVAAVLAALVAFGLFRYVH